MVSPLAVATTDATAELAKLLFKIEQAKPEAERLGKEIAELQLRHDSLLASIRVLRAEREALAERIDEALEEDRVRRAEAKARGPVTIVPA